MSEWVGNNADAADSEAELSVQGSVDEPAIGLVVSRGEEAEVARTIWRAQRRGHSVIVISDITGAEQTLEFAREFGAMIIDESDPGAIDPRGQLTESARAHGFPGLIYQKRLDSRLDFEKSLQALAASDQYVVDGESTIEVDIDQAVLVAIPAYNEAGSIGDVVRKALPYADEVLVVDDGSTDGTAGRAREAGATAVSHERNRGYGAALKTAFEQAAQCRADELVILDADGQHDPAEIPKLLGGLRDSEAEVVVGSRFVADSETTLPTYRRVGLGIVNTLTNLSLGALRGRSRVRDTQSGFRAYGRRAIESVAQDSSIGDGMGASTDILHHAQSQGYAIEEVGATVDYEVENANNIGPFEHGLHLVSNILRTIEDQHPILILGVPGFLLTLGGIGFGYWTIVNYLTSGSFPMGLALSSGVLALAGVFSAFTAIILHALNRHRQAMGERPRDGAD